MNGKASSIKITKHIKIQYFSITDRVKNGEVSVMCCRTGDIIGDYMNKPLHGAMLRKFRDQIMGVILDADPVPGNFNVEQLRKFLMSMISMVPPGNDGTTGVCWEKLKINWNNGYHPCQAGTDMVTS